MNFASEYVYDDCGEDDIYEAVSDEEFNEGMEVSDSSSDEEGDAAPEPVRACASPSGLLTMDPPPPPSPPRTKSESSNRPKASKLHHWKSDESSPYDSRSSTAGSRSKRMFRRADTNLVTVRFNTLKTPSTMHAGEVVMCQGCQAILSHRSRIEEDGEDKVWKCEFCDHHNIVDVEEGEKPSADDVTFLVEPSLSTTASGPSGRDESLVIFCVDISGSMCVTTEVSGYVKLRGGSQLRRLQHMNETREDQYLPNQRRDVTYISRLQAMQAAVDHQLGEMSRDYPHRRVALVAFNSEVMVISDGTHDVVTVTGDKLKSVEELTKLGSELPSPKAVKETRQSLGEKVFGLEEGGPTALGPALVVALSMASHQPGSKVIICTDGKANVGLGKLEDYQENPDDDQDPSEFYGNIADTANSKGVSISVITIQGTDCRLVHLGKLAEKTGGQVNIVDPLKLREEFSNILADRIIATGVVATFILHHGLYIKHENYDKNKERREIGNVTADTEISFEYGVRRRMRKQPPPEPPMTRIFEVSTSMEASSLPTGVGETTGRARDAEEPDAVPETAAGGESSAGNTDIIPSELPFQLQITYTDADGTKALRVITQKKPVTRDRQLAEENANLTVLGGHTTRLASELALQGDYTQSRGVALMNQRLAWRSTHSSRSPEREREKKKMYRQVFNKVRSVENVVQQKQRQEVSTRGKTYSDDEDEEVADCSAYMTSAGAINQLSASSCAEDPRPVLLTKEPVTKEKKMFKKKLRSAEVDDRMAQVMYQALTTNSSSFQPPTSKK